MANPTSVPGDLIVPGDLRVSGSITPALTKANILDMAELQAFTVPMNIWCEHDDYATSLVGVKEDMTPGTGISTGTGTICEHSVTKAGGLIKTEILLDVTGLNDGDTAGDVIGKDGDTANCHIGQITAAINGTIIAGRIHCLEVPAGGDVDIDFWGSVDEATLAQDTAISVATGEEQLIDHGDWAANEIDELTNLPDADGYLYIATGSQGTDQDYTGGIFLIELWGTPSAEDHLDSVGGTHGTSAPSLQTPDFGGNGGAASYYARGEIQLPWEYVAAQSVTIRLHAGMLTTVASEACTVDLAVYKSDEDSTSTGDLCATAATTINSLVFADIDFTITPTTLSPGDLLDVLITVSADDDGDAGVMKACIGSVQLLCDVR
jgi:hypothetical protein